MTMTNVIDALDGNTLVVSPAWHVGDSTGNLVRICGMDAPDLQTAEGQLARCKVCLLLVGSLVTVTHVYPPEGVFLPCKIEYHGLPLWMHFPEYAEQRASAASASEMPDISIDLEI